MTRDELEKRNVGENLDALMNLDPRGYGVCRILYAGSRKATGEPLTMHAAQTLGYPVLLRPSYVIGGQNMKIVHDDAEVTTYMQRILAQGIDNPVLVDKYMMGTELELSLIHI